MWTKWDRKWRDSFEIHSRPSVHGRNRTASLPFFWFIHTNTSPAKHAKVCIYIYKYILKQHRFNGMVQHVFFSFVRSWNSDFMIREFTMIMSSLKRNDINTREGSCAMGAAFDFDFHQNNFPYLFILLCLLPSSLSNLYL